jgi:acetyl-CoA C-acetyltransferase
VLVGSKEFGKKAGLKPRARIRSFASIGSEPAIMLTGPAPASEKALKRAGMSVSDIDLFELNEAFAAVVLRYMQASRCRTTRSTSTAARSPWAIRWAPPAR